MPIFFLFSILLCSCTSPNSDIRDDAIDGNAGMVGDGGGIQDCAGAWGGTATQDMCGTCDDIPGNDDITCVAFTSVSAGASHTCGVRQSDAQVQCWGRNLSGEATPPAGVAFTSVSAGEYHGCGIRQSDAQVQCWGDGT